jgi:hypothetical protein
VKAIAALAAIAFWAAATVLSFVIGVVIAASGHFNMGVGMAIALPVIVVFALLASRGHAPGPGPGAPEAPVPGLLRKINDVLDSTSAVPG